MYHCINIAIVDRYFPWDEQSCDLEMGSWTYDASALSLRKFKEGGDASLVTVDYVIAIETVTPRHEQQSACFNTIFAHCFDSLFTVSGDWELIGMPSIFISAMYPCCDTPYETIIFSIKVPPKT